jgi:hypothetical protein
VQLKPFAASLSLSLSLSDVKDYCTILIDKIKRESRVELYYPEFRSLFKISYDVSALLPYDPS